MTLSPPPPPPPPLTFVTLITMCDCEGIPVEVSDPQRSIPGSHSGVIQVVPHFTRFAFLTLLLALSAVTSADGVHNYPK